MLYIYNIDKIFQISNFAVSSAMKNTDFNELKVVSVIGI